MIAVTTQDARATVAVDDLAPLSRHDAALAEQLRDAIVTCADDDDVKVIVLRSDAEDFCAPSSANGLPGWSEVWTGFDQSFTASSALYQSVTFAKKVVITEISGRCCGAGALLALCSDLTIASHGASFTSPFLTMPESNLVLTALTMRLNRAKAWMLSTEALSAEIAFECGLVNAVVPEAELAAAVDARASAVTRMPLDGVTMSKMLMQSVLDAHGVGREFDMAGFYANALWNGDHGR